MVVVAVEPTASRASELIPAVISGQLADALVRQDDQLG
jgi:hypothetical protein